MVECPRTRLPQRQEDPVNVTLSQQLADYMHRKGYVAVTVETVNPIGCCADISEVATAFARPDHAARLKDEGCAVHATDREGLEVLVKTRGLDYDDEVALGLRSFLGVKDVTVQGIRPWRL